MVGETPEPGKTEAATTEPGDLLSRLAVAEETLRALRAGEVDALVMQGPDGVQRVYTLETADLIYRRLVERMTEGAGLLDVRGRVAYLNEQLGAMAHRPVEDVLGLPFTDLLVQGERQRFDDELVELGRSGHRAEYTMQLPDGGLVPVLIGIGLTGDEQQISHCVTVTDLSRRKEQEERVQLLNAELTDRLAQLRRLNSDLRQTQNRLLHQTLHDPMTGLPNRTLLLDRLEQALAGTKRTGALAAVCFVDVDGFKRVNDTLGHTAGDRLLRELTTRMSAVTRRGDTVARWGGDEFLVLAPTLASAQQAKGLARRLLSAAMNPPLEVEGMQVTVSVGVALATRHATADRLVQEADAAMYRAKERGGGTWQLFGPELRRELQMRLSTEEILRNALDEERLRVHYQPVVNLASREMLGAEALVRIQAENGALLSPTAFISTAEDTGLIVPLGRRVLQDACRQPREWQSRTHHPCYVSVNVSPRQLKEADLTVHVRESLAESGLRPEDLRLEITESAFIEIGPSVTRILHVLRDMGVQVGVDDFGTGYASMSYIRHLPLDFVKIDRSFVSGMLTDAHDLAIVEATLALASRLDLHSIAEGIETEEQAERLDQLGCSAGQGYLFSRPLPSESVGLVTAMR